MIQLIATPTEVRSARCPFCRSGPGQFCVGVRRVRKANHRERVTAYLRGRS